MKRKGIAALGLLALVAVACSSSKTTKRPVAKPGQIVTVLGAQRGAVLRDPGKTAALYNGLTVDAGGNLYVSDNVANDVTKVTPGGAITRLADCEKYFDLVGAKLGCLSPSTVSDPRGLVVDRSGTLFIVDGGNFRVRAVTAKGRRTDVVGSGKFGEFRPVDGPAAQ